MSDTDKLEYERLIEESKQVTEENVPHEESHKVKAPDGGRVILITVDESDYAQRAFDYALKNVLRSDDKDVAVLVHHYTVSGPSEFAPIALKAMANERNHRRTRGITLLKKLGKKLHENKIKVQANLLSGGDLRDAILEYSNKLKPEMLVVGCRGHGSLKRALLGSLSSHLVHHSEVPVLVVREKFD